MKGHGFFIHSAIDEHNVPMTFNEFKMLDKLISYIFSCDVTFLDCFLCLWPGDRAGSYTGGGGV